nr:MAG TPA: hypothetical protein [Caudoviricetes sp.]
MHKLKAGQGCCPDLSRLQNVNIYSVFVHKTNGTKSGTEWGGTRRDSTPVPASAAAGFSRSGQAGQSPVFQTRRGSLAPLV